MQWKIVWLRFWGPGFLHLPSADWRWQVCCTSGLTTAKLEYGQGKNRALRIGISHHGWFNTTLRCWACCSYEWYSGRARGSMVTASSVTPALFSISQNAGTAASTRNNLAVNYSKSNRNWYIGGKYGEVYMSGSIQGWSQAAAHLAVPNKRVHRDLWNYHLNRKSQDSSVGIRRCCFNMVRVSPNQTMGSGGCAWLVRVFDQNPWSFFVW